jgi:hypothetical protein
MKLLSKKDIPEGQVLQCSECHSRAPFVVELTTPTADLSTIKLCGDCVSKLWSTYWEPPAKLGVEIFNTKLGTDINKEVFPR